jgi:fatty-acyl-CoA synthase
MIGYQLGIQAARRPNQLALTYGAQQLTYPQLHARARRVAQALAADGVRRGDRVAVLLHNCSAFVETLFACALLGAIFVPINFRLVSREIAGVLDACTPRLLLAGESFADVVAQVATEGPAQAKRWVDDSPPATSEGPDDAFARWRDAHVGDAAWDHVNDF